MPHNAAHRSIWKTSDALAVVTLLLGLLLHALWPVDLGGVMAVPLRIGLGVGLGVAAGVMIVLAKRELRRHRQPAAPDRPTTRIVDTGIYGLSRNPLYLGLVGAFVGLGIASDILWWTVLSVPLAAAMQHWLIVPEERYLLTRFGAGYAAYQQRVRRWL